jgi:hypothetical protein
MPALETWQSAQGAAGSSAQLQFAIALVVLFFIPVLLFVVGTEHFGRSFKDVLRRPYWLSFKEVVVRGICWVCGGGLAFAVLAAASAFGAHAL